MANFNAKGRPGVDHDAEVEQLKQVLIDNIDGDFSVKEELADLAVQLIDADQRWTDDRTVAGYNHVMKSLDLISRLIKIRRKQVREEMLEVSPSFFDRSNKQHNRVRPSYSRADGRPMLTGKNKWEARHDRPDEDGESPDDQTQDK